MSTYLDWNEFIQRELQPYIVDTVILDKLEAFRKWFKMQTVLGGDRITSKYRVGYTSNAAAYTKSSVDVASATQTLVKPYWNKLFYQGKASVPNIDILNDAPSSDSMDKVGDAVAKETAAIMDVIQAAFLSQIVADVDSSSVAYSDKSLSRATYATLVSYEENTNATISLAYMRGMINSLANKGVDLADYVCMMERVVYNTFRPLAAALNTWQAPVVVGKGVEMGYGETGNFEGLAIAPSSDFTNMTTGDVIMVRRQDVQIVEHAPLRIIPKDEGRDTQAFGLYYGANIYVDNPYLQGIMTLKD